MLSLASEAVGDDRIARRASRLARALHRLGLSADKCVTVLVCDQHDEDFTAALAAISECDATSLVLDVDDPTETLAAQLTKVRSGFLLACSEGVDAWRATNVPMRTIGDGTDILWWHALEVAEMMRDR